MNAADFSQMVSWGLQLWISFMMFDLVKYYTPDGNMLKIMGKHLVFYIGMQICVSFLSAIIERTIL